MAVLLRSATVLQANLEHLNELRFGDQTMTSMSLDIGRHTVFGEDTSLAVPALLTVIGVAFLGTAVMLSLPSGETPTPAPGPTPPKLAANPRADDDQNTGTEASEPDPNKEPVEKDTEDVEIVVDDGAPIEEPSPVPKPAEDPDTCAPGFAVSFNEGWVKPQRPMAHEVHAMMQWLREHRRARLLIDGHSDSGGNPDFNLKLSYKRAHAIKRLFDRAGLPGDRVTPRAFGEYQPLTEIPTVDDRQRRVWVHVDGHPTCSQLNEKEQ